MVSFARAAAAPFKLFEQGIGTLAAGGHIIQLAGGRSSSGISVTTTKAMRYAAFWAAVRVLAESMASLPASVMRQTDKGAETVRTHPIHRLIHDLPNPQMTAYTWKEVGMTHLATWGMAYSLKVRDGTDRIRQLWPLAVDRMDPIERDRETGELQFTYHRLDGSIKELTSRDVFFVPGLSWDGYQGYSIIRNARETIGLGLATEEHGSRLFSSGVTTNFALSTDQKLSDDAWRHLSDQAKEEHTGLSHAWEPWVLEEGLKPVDISMPNDDAQWLETRKHQVTDIARWFRIPPHMLADLDRATFSNIEHQALEFVKYTLLPWIVRWEQAIGMQLLGDEWIGAGGDLFVKFNVNALERADMKTRFESYAIGRQWGFMNGDQIADLEDWNHFEGGDDYIVPMNMTTVGPDGSITTTTMGRARPAPPADEGAAAT